MKFGMEIIIMQVLNKILFINQQLRIQQRCEFVTKYFFPTQNINNSNTL